MYLLTDWFKRHFSNPEVVFLALALIAVFSVIVLFGDTLGPVLASIVIAYLLEGIVKVMERNHVPRLLAVMIVFILFMLALAVVIFGLMPLLSNQLTSLVQEIPNILTRGQEVLLQLPDRYPEIISAEQVNEIIFQLRRELTSWGQKLVTQSLSSVVGVITILLYFILMPILVFFFMKDKKRIIAWLLHYLPSDYKLAQKVWQDVDSQIANYIRGKFWEILIVWAVCFFTFSFFGLQYAMLLGLLVGLSVLIPFVGAAVVTIPVYLIAWFQWGWTPDFAYVAIAYLVIQALDGNLLVPVLFSEVVNLHPVAIITAILIFGGIWGIWGVFFAIPLATLVQAVLGAWPTPEASADIEP
ncbi:MAG: AI-2E family transporter [Proteobacteria bacterium]|nr:MAG: AI-2E family transporter [Pseudomonadota bacterium]